MWIKCLNLWDNYIPVSRCSPFVTICLFFPMFLLLISLIEQLVSWNDRGFIYSIRNYSFKYIYLSITKSMLGYDKIKQGT